MCKRGRAMQERYVLYLREEDLKAWQEHKAKCPSCMGLKYKKRKYHGRSEYA